MILSASLVWYWVVFKHCMGFHGTTFLFFNWVGLLLKRATDILSVPQTKPFGILTGYPFVSWGVHLYFFLYKIAFWKDVAFVLSLSWVRRVSCSSCLSTSNGCSQIICLEDCNNTTISFYIKFFSFPSLSYFFSTSSSSYSSYSSTSPPFDRAATHQLRSGEAKQSRIAQRWRLTLLALLSTSFWSLSISSFTSLSCISPLRSGIFILICFCASLQHRSISLVSIRHNHTVSLWLCLLFCFCPYIL